jgi:3-oxoacyl-[acyl-carrier-protein] synthase II
VNIGIRGIGVVGGFGCGLPALEAALLKRNGMANKVTMDASTGRIEVPALLADTSPLSGYVEKRALRRTDHYIRMGLLGSYMALEDAGMLDTARGRMGIIVATGYGATCNTFDFQQSVLNAADPCGSPTKFSNSVHNAAASYISIMLDEMGPTLSVSHFDLSVPSALLTALQWLRSDRVDTVLVGGIDEYCKVLGYYWHCRYGNGAGADQPPTRTQHAIIGEGACFFVLQKQTATDAPYGFIEDVRMTRFRRGPLGLPQNAIYFLGADGYSECENDYPGVLPHGTRAAIYTPLYGGLPVGTAFDLAIAGLSRRRGTIFESCDGIVPESVEIDRIDAVSRHDGGRICCLKLGAGGFSGWITLNGCGSTGA